MTFLIWEILFYLLLAAGFGALLCYGVILQVGVHAPQEGGHEQAYQEVEALRTRLDALMAARKQREAQLAGLEARYRHLQELLDASVQERDQLEESLNQPVDQLEEQNQLLRDRNHMLQGEVEALRGQLDEESNALAQANVALAISEDERRLLAGRLSDFVRLDVDDAAIVSDDAEPIAESDRVDADFRHVQAEMQAHLADVSVFNGPPENVQANLGDNVDAGLDVQDDLEGDVQAEVGNHFRAVLDGDLNPHVPEEKQPDLEEILASLGEFEPEPIHDSETSYDVDIDLDPPDTSEPTPIVASVENTLPEPEPVPESEGAEDEPWEGPDEDPELTKAREEADAAIADRALDVEEATRVVAYLLWLEDGKPEDKAKDLWFRAETRVRDERALNT